MIDEIKITSDSGRGSVTMKTQDLRGYWLGPVDWGQVEGQHQTYSYYNQVGESIVSTTVLSRPLSITGWVIDDGQNTIQSRCDFLNSFFSPVEDYTLEYKDRKISFRPDRSVIYSREFISNNHILRKFLLQATCPYPLFSGVEDTEVGFDYSGKLFRFPQNFGRKTPVVFATTQKAYRVDIDNKGGFSTGMIIRIRFSGDVTNPKIHNMTTGKFIGVNRTFQRGEVLEISTIRGEKYIILRKENGTEENLIKNRHYQTSWIQLEPGQNRLALDCDDLEQRVYMEATVSFTPLYLEVE